MKKKLLLCGMLLIMLCVVISVGVAAIDWFGVETEGLFDILKNQSKLSQSDVVAEVNGEKIYRQSIDAALKSKEMSVAYIEENSNNNSAFNKQIAEKEIINEKIRNIVVRKEAERLGLKADYEEAKKAALEAYNISKEKGNEQQYQFLQNYMKAMDYTEEEYIEILTQGYVEMYTRANLYNEFVQGRDESYDVLVAEYEDYVKKLIEKADIVYK